MASQIGRVKPRAQK